MDGDNAELKSTLHDTSFNFVYRLNVDFRVHFNCLLIKTTQCLVDMAAWIAGGLVKNSDAQGAGQALVEIVYLVAEFFHRPHDLERATVDGFALGRQGKTTAAPSTQGDPKPQFQVFDMT